MKELATTEPSYLTVPPHDAVAERIRTLCWSGAHKDWAAGAIRLFNMPTENEKVILRARHKLLVDQLMAKDVKPFKRIAAACLQMLACYTQNQQGRGEGEKEYEQRIRQLTAQYTAELKIMPAWAVELTCSKIRMGLCPGISTVHPPATMAVLEACRAVTAPYMDEAVQIDGILRALPAAKPVTPEQRERTKQRFDDLLKQLRAGSLETSSEDKLREKDGEVFARSGITAEMLDKIPNAPKRVGNFVR